MEPEQPGAGADPSRLEPELAPGPWRPGAGGAQKSGGSATLLSSLNDDNFLVFAVFIYIA